MSTPDIQPTPPDPEPASVTPEAAAPASASVPRRPLWMRVAGLKRRPGKRLRWGLTRWGMFLTAFLVLVGGMAGFAEYSMQPDFCRSCHIMEPYYQAWHTSTHKNVPCTDCHFEPGFDKTLYGKFQASSQGIKYITNTYGSKPHAEIRDSSCSRAMGSDGVTPCHDQRVLSGKVDWPVKSERGGTVTIKFDHTPHLTLERRGKQLRCVSCHSQIVQGQHLVVTTDTCFLCHFKGLKHGRDDETVGTCRGCHDEPRAPIPLPTGLFNHTDYTARGVKCENCHADTVRGDGAVPQQVCWTCHNQPAQIARYGEPNMLHKAHVSEHKVECSACHVQIEHSLVAGARETHMAGTRFATDAGTCGSCHEQLHAGPREMFRGTGGRGVPDMPSPMARARVNCIACHMTKKENSQDAPIRGQTFVATQDRCDYCHADKYKGVLGDWQKLVKENLDKAEAALLTARKLQAAARISSEDALKVARLLDDADHNVRFVKLGHGVHNVTYATALCSVAQDRCREATNLMSQRAGTPE